MNGNKLKQLIAISSFTATQVAKSFNISREHLYQLYKKADIGKEYSRLAENIGLTELDKTLHDRIIIPTADDGDFWKQLALSQQSIIASLTKSNGTLSESNNTISESNKVIAEANKKSLEIVETISKKILSLLQGETMPIVSSKT